MFFGLMTGSYAKNTSGGVLRKAMGSPAVPLSSPDPTIIANGSNEIDPSNGVFNASAVGIIATFNRLHGTGFSASNATQAYAYDTAYTGQVCGWIATGPIAEGNCQMWGNPIAEIMYESMRYFAGKGAALPDFATGFGAGEESQLPGGGLPVATWSDPYATGAHPRCAKPFQTVISDINPTYDSDQLPGVATTFNASGGIDSRQRWQFPWAQRVGAGTDDLDR